jgi:hypothetical protein
MPANIEVRLDEQHSGAALARRNRRRQPSSTGADDYDVGFVCVGPLSNHVSFL